MRLTVDKEYKILEYDPEHHEQYAQDLCDLDEVLARESRDWLYPLRDEGLEEQITTQTVEQEVAGWVKKNYVFFILDLKTDKAVGLLVIGKHPQMPKTASVHTFIVHKDYKRQGLGRMLMNKAKLFCDNNKVDYLILGVMANNTGAVQFYKSQGFEPYSHHMFTKV